MWCLKLHQQFKYLHLIHRSMYAKTEFNQIPERFSFPTEEEKILKFWEEKQCFKKQLELTKDLPPFTFYDGPPFATGTPHYGHICAGTIKDVICRYASQTGHYVSRRFGWDCHGLPVEYEIDKALNIKDKRQILEMGIDKYNNQCRSIVMRYSNLWETVINRFGRWIDFKNDYKTLDLNFMESVWYVFKTLFDKGLVYRGRKIMPYSNAVHTVLSNFQVQMNYKQVQDPSLWVNFPLVKDPQVKFLVWTTTPWTLPSNLALAVNPDFIYVKVKDLKRNETFILAECRLNDFYKPKKKKKGAEEEKQFQVIEKIKGTDLAGIEYVPIFDFFLERAKDGAFKVRTAGFVTSDAGTGIVHCAPGFGQEDYKMCLKEKIIHPDNPVLPLDQNGKFTKQVPTYQGVYVKDADPLIIKELKERGRVVRSQKEAHNYPYCWRSDTPLIYKAVACWFIKVTDLKDDLIENNMKAYWVPKVIQQKRFNNWLKDSQDWCFSRSRYWGNPIPLWVSDDGEQIVCVGSVQQLADLTGVKVTDLHRQHIDHLTIKSKQGKGVLRRIQEVFDCWFESGSMPYAQVHYPFSTSEEQFSKIFPADFIAEGIDQTRGWFYTLNVISTAMRNSHPYKNLIVNGLVLNHQGKKMSKRLKNYPEPDLVCNEFGADAVRLYLINSPLVRADSLNFSQDGVKQVVKNIFLPWYNAYRFLIQNIMKYEAKNNDTFRYNENLDELEDKFNVTDRWIESSLQILIVQVRKQMEEYKLYNVVAPLVKFLQSLTNWYVRLNRPRLKGEIDDANMLISLNVLFDVLFKVNILMSPHVPFLTEHMYQNMKKAIKEDSKKYQDSIHHLYIPEPIDKLKNQKVNQLMQVLTQIIEAARNLREKKNISLKQPIMSLTFINKSGELFEDLKPFLNYVEQEINVAKILFDDDIYKYVKLTCLPNLPVLGPKFKGNKAFGTITKAISALETDKLKQCREKGKIIVEGHQISIDQILIQQKFRADNIQDYQIIGGEKHIVLLDTRQDEQLKIKGFARQIINRIQKLKKKAHMKAEDEVLILYNFEEESTYLRKAVENQFKTIKNAVKKPLLSIQLKEHLVTLDSDKGSINGQNYEIYLTYPHFTLNKKELNESFGDKAKVLGQCLLSKPYEVVKNTKQFKIILDGKQYVLQAEKHYLQH